ncbi:hypothetical protein [Paracidovorax sp. MALMAid1276]|uniref:hypothetical protein n=1 Tax=Paracidovorax sp. MALMAid1276 TaxID=3411631 RepID=UPI003B9BEAC5
MLPVLGVLRAVRAVLLALTLLHAGLLFVVGRGSLPGLLVMAAVWWGLGRLLQLAPDPRARARGGSTAAAKARTEQALQERLHQVAQTRNPGKKKQP